MRACSFSCRSSQALSTASKQNKQTWKMSRKEIFFSIYFPCETESPMSCLQVQRENRGHCNNWWPIIFFPSFSLMEGSKNVSLSRNSWRTTTRLSCRPSTKAGIWVSTGKVGPRKDLRPRKGNRKSTSWSASQKAGWTHWRSFVSPQ